MKKVAIIPLRAGSKGIPGKNRKKLLGRPMFCWSLGEAIKSNLDEVYVYTDDQKIIEFVKEEYKWCSKVKILERSEDSATDTASTEFAMQEFSTRIGENYDILCLLQATSPLIKKENINECLDKIEKESYDSALSVVRTKRFVWSESGESLNYDYKNRPRRQDFDGMLMENGAVYGTTKEQFLKSGIRIGGKIAIIEMPEDSLIKIDEKEDWIIVEKLIENNMKKNKRNSKKIKVLCLDVDGVFTDGNITNNLDGEFSKVFSMRDGMGLEILRENGIEIIIMTSENSKIVESRMRKLNLLDNLYLGIKDKYTRLEKVLQEKSLTRAEVAYIGDDVNDLANLLSVGWGIVPNDGIENVKLSADLVLNNAGGNKAIREAVNFILKYNSRM
ncbi:MAG: cytidylyltransferase domain-containing protein [Fusobacteriaceae bacterium]